MKYLQKLFDRYWAQIIIALIWALCFQIGFNIGYSLAFDHGEYQNADPATRMWFRGVRSPNGIPCCDIADGHHTAWRAGADGDFQVPIDGVWVDVPPEAVVRDAGNPTGEAVVWYVRQGTHTDGTPSWYIRCFVPEAQG